MLHQNIFHVKVVNINEIFALCYVFVRWAPCEKNDKRCFFSCIQSQSYGMEFFWQISVQTPTINNLILNSFGDETCGMTFSDRQTSPPDYVCSFYELWDKNA